MGFILSMTRTCSSIVVLLYQESGLSLGVPVLDVAVGGGVEISAAGGLARYDTLTFWFNPQGTLQDIVFEKASDRSYLKTLFSK